jgi:hypothetical protein
VKVKADTNDLSLTSHYSLNWAVKLHKDFLVVAKYSKIKAWLQGLLLNISEYAVYRKLRVVLKSRQMSEE